MFFFSLYHCFKVHHIKSDSYFSFKMNNSSDTGYALLTYYLHTPVNDVNLTFFVSRFNPAFNIATIRQVFNEAVEKG